MDVGDPSNFVRILDMFDNDIEKLKQMLSAYAYNDEQIKQAITEVYNAKQYVLCPHTATGYLAVKDLKASASVNEKTAYIILATAHPCKFPDVFEELNIKYDEPAQVAELYKKEKHRVEMGNSFEEFKQFLLG
jgi:threonine synthase